MCCLTKDKVTLTLSDMKVTIRHHSGWMLKDHALFSVHTVGLYIIISVPSKGITLIWDKNTRVTVELQPQWKVSDFHIIGFYIHCIYTVYKNL